MKQEDAINTIVNWIREDCPSQYSRYGYEVYLPNLITHLTSDTQRQREISTALYDAAWDLCRRGILRPGVKQAGGQATDDGGYCITHFGRQWLTETNHAFVPTEPERFGEMIEPFKGRFGPGYFERAQQAIRCYGAHAYLACCSMCGAAAESILLATAIAKTKGDEQSVLKAYRASGGRKRVEDQVIGQVTEPLKREFTGLTILLKYWRDEASHGQASDIGDNEAYTSMVMLLRYSMFIDHNWAEFTK